MIFDRKKQITRLPYAPINSEIYDAAYFSGKTSNWHAEYTWSNFHHIFIHWARILIENFPQAKSFIDVGCARGFLEKALVKLCNINELTDREIEGFDHSEYAVSTCEDDIREMIKVSSVDNYEFEKAFDVLVCLDVFEHLTDLQAQNFLQKAAKNINMFGLWVIALDNGDNENDITHINLKQRSDWDKIFLNSGWYQDKICKEKQYLLQNDQFIVNAKCEVFIYKPVGV